MFSKPNQFIQTVHGLVFPVYSPAVGALSQANGNNQNIGGQLSANGNQTANTAYGNSGSSQNPDKT